jgi:hypothetical protein
MQAAPAVLAMRAATAAAMRAATAAAMRAATAAAMRAATAALAMRAATAALAIKNEGFRLHRTKILGDGLSRSFLPVENRSAPAWGGKRR